MSAIPSPDPDQGSIGVSLPIPGECSCPRGGADCRDPVPGGDGEPAHRHDLGPYAPTGGAHRHDLGPHSPPRLKVPPYALYAPTGGAQHCVIPGLGACV